MARIILAVAFVATLMSGCAAQDESDADWDAYRAQQLDTWRRIGQAAGEYMRDHPGQPLPAYLGPPPSLGATDCTSEYSFGELVTSCDSY
jgi:hypothetical protein